MGNQANPERKETAYEKPFAERLLELRRARDMSARKLSILLGKNPGYVNGIESGKAFPSMDIFFRLCDALHVTPREFFGKETVESGKRAALLEKVGKLTKNQFTIVESIMDEFEKGKQNEHRTNQRNG